MDKTLAKWLVLVTGVAFLFTLTSCRDPNLVESGYFGTDSNLIEASYYSTDRLIEQMCPPCLQAQGKSVLVSSFVNIDNLEESSTFGRTISEYMASRLSQHNFNVVEIKLRDSIWVNKDKGGEFLLSRDIEKLRLEHEAHAIVAGTYSIGKDVVFVSARIISIPEKRIISSYAYRMPLGDNIRMMLGEYGGY